MLKRYLVALLLSFLLLGCQGGDEGGQSPNQKTSDVTNQSRNQQQDQQTQQVSDEGTTQTSDESLSFDEIQEAISVTQGELRKLGFVFVMNDQKVALEVLTDSKFSPMSSLLRDGVDVTVKTTKFDLVSGYEYCRFKDLGLGKAQRYLRPSKKALAKCREEIFKRHKDLVGQLANLEYLETELLENHADELTENQQVTHLAKLKLSIQIRELSKRYDRYLHEKQKFIVNLWGRIKQTLTNEEIENVIVISDYQKTPYHVHLMASKNSPKLGELAQQGKITLIGDLEEGLAFDQLVRVYKTSLFTYVQVIDSES